MGIYVMNLISLGLNLLGGGKGKLVLGLVAALILVVVIGGMYVRIQSLKTDVAKTEKVNAELESDISGYKLEVRNRDTEISLLKESGNQTARVILGLKSQVVKLQSSASWYRQKHAKAVRLLQSARNYPVTNSTGVLSYEKSRLAAEFINDALGLQSEAYQ